MHQTVQRRQPHPQCEISVSVAVFGDVQLREVAGEGPGEISAAGEGREAEVAGRVVVAPPQQGLVRLDVPCGRDTGVSHEELHLSRRHLTDVFVSPLAVFWMSRT